MVTDTNSVKERLLHYMRDPVAFVRDVIEVEPTEQQHEVLASLTDNLPIAVRSGHGVGKTAVAAWTILWFLVLHPYARVPCTAPTDHQLKDILWPELKYWIERSRPLQQMVSWSKEKVSVIGWEDTWFAVARTASKPENLQGFHGRHILFVVDEASGVEQEIMEVVEGALTNEGAMLVMLGNPTRISGTFYQAFHRDRELYHAFHFDSQASPLVSDTYVQRVERKYGRDSDVFRVRVAGEFPRGEANTFIRLDMVEAAVSRRVRVAGNWSIGVDPARFGDDESVIATRRGNHVFPLEGYHNADGWQLGAHVIARVKRIRAEGYEKWIDVRVDETGIGASCIDYLRRMQRRYRIRVIPINFGWPGTAEYYNCATTLWGILRERLPQMHLPEDPELVSQLTTRTYAIHERDTRIVIQPKRDMKKQGLPSPDRGDAVALCVSNINPEALDVEDMEAMMDAEDAEVLEAEMYSANAEVL